MKLTRQTSIKILTVFTAIALTASAGSTAPRLDGVSFDPGIISAGDRVNISANLRATDYPEKDWNPERELKAVLEPGNRLTERYVTIEKNRDESIGFLYPEGIWNQRYSVKVDSGAPTGRYGFEIHIRYLEDGESVEIEQDTGSSISVIRRFSMPVDQQGVDISGNVEATRPQIPRPGNQNVNQNIAFTNTGNKPIEEIEIYPEAPKGMTPSYSSDEKFYINRLETGKTARKTLTLDLEDSLSPGLHNVTLNAVYEDRSGNSYSETLGVPLRIEGRPDLETSHEKLRMKAGDTVDLPLEIENTGEQDAESVSARVISERAQPFSLEDRSGYIGEIESGDTGETILRISAERSAEQRSHRIQVQLRANGDSEEGDRSVYTFTETKEIEINGRRQSPLIYTGTALAVLVAAAGAYRYRRRQKKGDDL